MLKIKKTVLLGSLLPLLMIGGHASTAMAEPSVEVMHQWTSGGESAALKVLKDALAEKGIGWVDSAVAGGGGANQKQVLQARFAAGNPPSAVIVGAGTILEYAFALGDLSKVAQEQKWETLIDPGLLSFLKVDGKFIGAPFNTHRENMLWINKPILDQYGGKAPTTWAEFNELASRMQADGLIPVALGGEEWQEAEIFSNIVLGLGGAELYKKVFVELDSDAITSPQVIAAFDQLRKVISFTDKNRAGRDWNVATSMVINGKAAMQFMGDWANGEFKASKQVLDKDYVCVTSPGSGSDFVFIADTLGFFEQSNKDSKGAVEVMATLAMDKKVQEEFNLLKGSIPGRLDISAENFDGCSKLAMADRATSSKNGGMVPSFVESHASGPDVRGIFMDVITNYSNSDMSSQDAVKAIAKGIKYLN